ncbi:magnesium transporter [soil metagenome]
MLGKALETEILELIETGDFDTLTEVLVSLSPAEVGEILEDIPNEATTVILGHLPPEFAGEAFASISLEQQEDLLTASPGERLSSVLNEMPPDDRTRLLESLPDEQRQSTILSLNAEEREVAESLLDYPEGSLGRLMTPDYITVRRDWTVERVMRHVRAEGRESETINVLYVVDEDNHLLADLRLRQVVMARPGQKVEELMESDSIVLKATDDEETAVLTFRKYYRAALPVIDDRGKLVGIVTVDDVLDLAEEKATEDMQRMGGTEALEEPYLRIDLRKMVKKRAGWLVVLFLGELLTATAMGYFEHEIEKAVVLALFIPLIMSSGGNSGSQASTLVIRALTLGEVSIVDWWRVAKRELISGASLGLILGSIGFLRVLVWTFFSNIYGPHWLMLAVTIFFTLFGIVLWGAVAGSMLPLIMKRIGADPAVSSAPFVATLVDVTGIVIYFTIASTLLRGTLLP